jgi:AcrR family transcriptional regulator
MSGRSTRPMLDPAVQAEFRRRTITTALAEVCADRGYPKTTIANVAAQAATGRGTVYSLYANREEILLDLLDQTAAEFLSLSEGACTSATCDPEARIKAGLAATLGWAAERPARAHTFLVTAPSATPASQRRYQRAISDLAALLRTVVPDRDPRAARLEEITVGRLVAILAGEAREGRLANAPTLLDDFHGLVTARF